MNKTKQKPQQCAAYKKLISPLMMHTDWNWQVKMIFQANGILTLAGVVMLIFNKWDFSLKTEEARDKKALYNDQGINSIKRCNDCKLYALVRAPIFTK